VLTRSGLAESAVVGVYALGSSALLDPKNPEAAVNRRLTLLAIPKEGKPTSKKRGKSKPTPLEESPSQGAPEGKEGKSKSRKNFERALGIDGKGAPSE
jgi:hypothetical protein